MSVGALLSAAFEMYKRHFAALVLSSLLLFAVSVGVLLVFILVFTTVFSTLLFTSVVLALVVLVAIWIVVSFIADVVGIAFAGGQYRMLIMAEREQRVARVGDLWSALRYIPSFLAWAVVVNVLALAAFLVILLGGWLGVQSGSNLVAYVLFGVAILVLYWLTVRWVWVIPSIGDSGASLIAAMRKSSLMVRQVGWWRTFGLLLLIIGINLGVFLVVNIVLTAAGNALPAILAAVLALAPLIVFITPFQTCFLTGMYRASQVQAGLPDAFVLSPVPFTGGTGLAFRQAVDQVKEAARELKSGTASQAPVGAAPPFAAGGPARTQAGGGVAAASPAASSFAAFCGKCGTPRNGEARFCRQCGNSLERSAPS